MDSASVLGQYGSCNWNDMVWVEMTGDPQKKHLFYMISAENHNIE